MEKKYIINSKKRAREKSIVEVLSKKIQKEFPEVKGFSASNLWRMRNFYLTYKDIKNLAPLVREISWTREICICVLTYIVVIAYSYIVRNYSNIY